MVLINYSVFSEKTKAAFEAAGLDYEGHDRIVSVNCEPNRSAIEGQIYLLRWACKGEDFRLRGVVFSDATRKAFLDAEEEFWQEQYRGGVAA